VMADTTKIALLDFAGRTERLDRSTMAPFEPCVTTLVRQEVLL